MILEYHTLVGHPREPPSAYQLTCTANSSHSINQSFLLITFYSSIHLTLEKGTLGTRRLHHQFTSAINQQPSHQSSFRSPQLLLTALLFIWMTPSISTVGCLQHCCDTWTFDMLLDLHHMTSHIQIKAQTIIITHCSHVYSNYITASSIGTSLLNSCSTPKFIFFLENIFAYDYYTHAHLYQGWLSLQIPRRHHIFSGIMQRLIPFSKNLPWCQCIPISLMMTNLTLLFCHVTGPVKEVIKTPWIH